MTVGEASLKFLSVSVVMSKEQKEDRVARNSRSIPRVDFYQKVDMHGKMASKTRPAWKPIESKSESKSESAGAQTQTGDHTWILQGDQLFCYPSWFDVEVAVSHALDQDAAAADSSNDSDEENDNENENHSGGQKFYETTDPLHVVSVAESGVIAADYSSAGSRDVCVQILQYNKSRKRMEQSMMGLVASSREEQQLWVKALRIASKDDRKSNTQGDSNTSTDIDTDAGPVITVRNSPCVLQVARGSDNTTWTKQLCVLHGLTISMYAPTVQLKDIFPPSPSAVGAAPAAAPAVLPVPIQIIHLPKRVAIVDAEFKCNRRFSFEVVDSSLNTLCMIAALDEASRDLWMRELETSIVNSVTAYSDKETWASGEHIAQLGSRCVGQV